MKSFLGLAANFDSLLYVDDRAEGRKLSGMPASPLLAVQPAEFFNEIGGSQTSAAIALMSAFRVGCPGSGRSAIVKSFGRREAYESPRGRNPRTPVEGYGDFDLRLMCAVAGSQSASGMLDGGQVASLRTRAAFRVWPRLAATLSAAMIATDACGSVAGSGVTPATEVLTMPCRVMKPSPGSSPSHPAVRAAASSIRTSR